jgi:hypothetical protein
MDKDPSVYVHHILEAIANIEADAVVRIGERIARPARGS